MKRKSQDLPRNCWNCREGTESASGRPHVDPWKHNHSLHPGDNFPQGSVSTSSSWHYLKGKTCDKNGEFFSIFERLNYVNFDVNTLNHVYALLFLDFLLLHSSPL